MFGLEPTILLLLFFCILIALFFEFINGFHDTANAVATVIYTNSLKPQQAVIWSGIWNSIGVLGLLTLGEKLGVANKIIGLLPSQILTSGDLSTCIAIVLSILFTSILWNLGTWYYGIPCSSSHTLIGSILGAGIGFAIANEQSILSSVKWSEASHIGLSLLISPLIGFTFTVACMFILKQVVKKNKQFFEAPKGKVKPKFFTRLALIGTCTAVSYSHGSNDGQKGIGLMMLILIGFAPTFFSLNGKIDKLEVERYSSNYVKKSLQQEIINSGVIASKLNASLIEEFQKLETIVKKETNSDGLIIPQKRLETRELIVSINVKIHFLLKESSHGFSVKNRSDLKNIASFMEKQTGHVPLWVKICISLALGLGTMVGWKRIVETIGEKIGKEHLSYAQGLSAELVAATTIQLATSFSLPVSTTQVLSSGIAGSMVASNGVKNLQPKTIKNIALAWILTFPVCVFGSVILFLLISYIF